MIEYFCILFLFIDCMGQLDLIVKNKLLVSNSTACIISFEFFRLLKALIVVFFLGI